MPSGDRTGPLGEGPMTGRRMGYCTGEDQPGYMFNTGFGFKRGRGQNTGFGRIYHRAWNRFAIPLSENINSITPTQMNALRNEVADLKQKLNQVLDEFNSFLKEKGSAGKK